MRLANYPYKDFSPELIPAPKTARIILCGKPRSDEAAPAAQRAGEDGNGSDVGPSDRTEIVHSCARRRGRRRAWKYGRPGRGPWSRCLPLLHSDCPGRMRRCLSAGRDGGGRSPAGAFERRSGGRSKFVRRFGVSTAFSRKVATGFRLENATNKESRARFRLQDKEPYSRRPSPAPGAACVRRVYGP